MLGTLKTKGLVWLSYREREPCHENRRLGERLLEGGAPYRDEGKKDCATSGGLGRLSIFPSPDNIASSTASRIVNWTTILGDISVPYGGSHPDHLRLSLKTDDDLVRPVKNPTPILPICLFRLVECESFGSDP